MSERNVMGIVSRTKYHEHWFFLGCA